MYSPTRSALRWHRTRRIDTPRPIPSRRAEPALDGKGRMPERRQEIPPHVRQMPPDNTRWHQVAPHGIRWHQMAPDGNGGRQLGPAGTRHTRWRQMAPDGTT